MKEFKQINFSSPDYPLALKKVKKPPKTIYLKGNLPQGPFFAIVGTRRPSPYGRQAALEFSQDLTQAGLNIVSGLALGIDALAHQGCLGAGGKTVAVLGTGIDEASFYPKENLNLSRKIAENGAVISEFAPGTRGSKWSFPQRNRLISGLCSGVLVIEAKKKSGALITASWAKEQHKKIFALPGSIYSSNSWGPNYLISQGAYPAQSSESILKRLDSTNIRQSSIKTAVVSNKNLSPEEKLVIDVLKNGPAHIEELVKKTDLSASKTCSVLAIMETQGKIRHLGGNIFSLKK